MEPNTNEKQHDGQTAISPTSEHSEKGPNTLEAVEAIGSGWSQDGLQLHPKPTCDPLDPLNWSSAKKHGILAIVMWKYFLFTYATTTTVPAFPQTQERFNISYSQVNWTVAVPALGLAIGPLFWSSLADIFGRRIIFITGTVIALVATIGTAVATSYDGYMAASLFFEHERGQKLGLWVLSIDSGLLVGPLVGGFISLVSEAWISWLTALFFATLLIAEVLFMTETLYPRRLMLMRMPAAVAHPAITDVEKVVGALSNASNAEIKRTKELTFLNVKPVPRISHPKPWDSITRFIWTLKYPTVWIPVFFYCFAWYWWILSIITYIPAAYVRYSPQIQGLLLLGLLLGTLFSELLCSGRLSDRIILKLMKRNDNVRVAEMRLWLAYPAALLSASNTIVSSYIVDCYPLQSMSVITFYSVLLNLSAFANPFFITPWVTSSGYTKTFAVQGVITFFVSVPVFALVHWFGPRLRDRAGQPYWVNPEYDNRFN
ncbi:hypothetical protein GP486_006526 [Trichoglossum hirsutum]|uniref:Major facilitator superfamily (MFS) profile domain-containing protein n=1 Tax=Trichoglossum hirsutum TaxID=265104 RepID=A0A9P8L7C7_9PEZI|nr:hypothetical protein GP486_006526 [Trichoglossum hirsutum]